MSHEAQDRAAEMLAEAAEMDLALARRIHARAMAAEDDAALADLTRAQQRALRSMRQSLALGARMNELRARADLARANADQARSAAARAGTQAPRKPDYPGVRRRAAELYDAVGRVIVRFTECEAEREALFEFLDDWVVNLEPTTDFEAVGLDAQVADFCDQFEIPAALYAGWRDLPPVAFEPGPEAGPDPAGSWPQPAGVDSG